MYINIEIFVCCVKEVIDETCYILAKYLSLKSFFFILYALDFRSDKNFCSGTKIQLYKLYETRHEFNQLGFAIKICFLEPK